MNIEAAAYLLFSMFIVLLAAVFAVVARCDKGEVNMSGPYKRLQKSCRNCWDFTDGPEDELCAWCKKTPEELERISRLDLLLAMLSVCMIFAMAYFNLDMAY